jgi:hypothetical protein
MQFSQVTLMVYLSNRAGDSVRRERLRHAVRSGVHQGSACRISAIAHITPDEEGRRESCKSRLKLREGRLPESESDGHCHLRIPVIGHDRSVR